MYSTFQVWLDRITTALFSLTLAFAFCGLFLLPEGKTILGNMLALSIILGGINFFIAPQFNIGLRDRRILWVFLGYAGFILFNRIVHGDQYGVMRSLGYVALFGLLVPRKMVVINVSRYAIIFGGLGMGGVSIWQQYHGIQRVEGFTNAILFSQASLTVALLAWEVRKEVSVSWWVRAGVILSFLMALYSLYASQSRGVWLSFIIVVAIVLTFKAFRKPRKYLFVSLILLGGSFVFYNQSGVLQERMQASISDIQYAERGAYGTSWGLRMVAWQGAWQGFLTAPILGVGTDGFDAMKKLLVASGISSPLLLDPQLAHSHNQYMQNLFIRGAAGGIALLLLLGLPMWWATKCFGGMSTGVLLPVSFAISGLSDVPFEHQNILFLYALGLVFVWLHAQETK